MTDYEIMSQQQEQGQSNVRVIPIFVEGRDEPVINRDFPDAGPPPQMHHHHHEVPPQRMPPQPDLDFGRELPSFRHGSIFDRTKDFPVRNIRDEFFRDRMSPSRGESPIRNIPMTHMFGRGPSPQPQERPRTYSGSFEQQRPAPQQRKRTSSRNEDQQYHQPHPHPQPAATGATANPSSQEVPSQQQQKPQPTPVPVQKEATPPPPPKLGPIEKIQQIQREVLDLMTEVEKFEGKTRRDKEYIYLDEMLTQNLLKLDTIDTDGQEKVKLARKEAVKCINRCLSVLEAKAEAVEEAIKAGTHVQTEQPESQAAGNDSNKSEGEQLTSSVPPNTAQVEIEHQPTNEEQTTQEPVKQSSRGSIYDNHDPTSTDEKTNNEARSNVAAPQQQTNDNTAPQVIKSKESTPVRSTEETNNVTSTPPVENSATTTSV